MFLTQLGKEVKVFFTSKGNLIFMFCMPILLITIFSYALKDYMGGSYGTFDNAKVLYLVKDSTQFSSFENIKVSLESLGVAFEETTDYEAACKDVEASKAYGVITLEKEGFSYFRSSFNEPEGGKLVRTLFVQMAGDTVTMDFGDSTIQKSDDNDSAVKKIMLSVQHFESKNYYTFAGLAFSIMFMGLLVAFIVYDEKEHGTIERIRLSNAGIPSMIFSKVLTGVLCGLVMITASYIYSTVVLKVNWGEKKGYILLILVSLVLFSAVFGCVVGLLGKNKTMCQSMVMMFAMLCGYLGGSITPLYLLENVPVLNWIIKISPLYYVNRSVTSLYSGIVDEKLIYSISVLGGLTVTLIFIGIAVGKKVNRKE
jgi:ABC-2 type transport system permease protein